MKQIYNSLWNENIVKIKAGDISTDNMIGHKNDRRRGLSLIMRTSPDVSNKFSGFLDACRNAEPYQYYYPASDYHITMLSIFSCSETFSLQRLSLNDYIEKISRILQNTEVLSFHHQGITVSSACVLIQGYSTTINNIRKQLRQSLNSLENTSDLRYQLKTAHSTVARFVQPLKNPDNFASFLESYRNHDFGFSEIKSVELVLNDWYLSCEHTETLHKFTLGG